jgi:hypothetical protein
MAEAPKPPEGGDKKSPTSRLGEFQKGRGRPRLTVHKVSLATLHASLPGVHKIPHKG